MMMDVLDAQLARVRQRHAAALIESSSDGQRVLVVPGVRAGTGWNMEAVTVRILVPAGFPQVKLDCFYTDAGLRLASGVEPNASNVQAVFGGQYRWFSWHLQSWDPATGSLEQYVNFCRRRLQEAR